MSGIKLEIGPKKLKKRWTIGTFLVKGSGTGDGKEINVVINYFFKEMLEGKLITYINIEQRRKIKGDIAKAVYRFYSGQTDETFKHKLIDLCRAINLDTGKLPKYELRRQIKKALDELRKIGFLKIGEITSNDLVVWGKRGKAKEKD